MKENESIIKIIKIVSIVIVIILLIIIFLDYFNIRSIFPFNQLTIQYDWLGVVAAIIGGLLSAVGTYIGIILTLENERENNEKKDIEERKRNGYSYLTFTNNPIILTISLDSIIWQLNDKQNILIGTNVRVDGNNYLDIELNFKNLNNNYPSAALIEDMLIQYDFNFENNKKNFNKSLFLKGYNKEYKSVTIKNNESVDFSSKALINKNELEELVDFLVKSEFIDVTLNIKFANANGVVTYGQYMAELKKENSIKIGTEKCQGSNKEKINYVAENTYFIIKNIEYMENYTNKIFGGTNG